jgi:hypothetical protein
MWGLLREEFEVNGVTEYLVVAELPGLIPKQVFRVVRHFYVVCEIRLRVYLAQILKVHHIFILI